MLAKIIRRPDGWHWTLATGHGGRLEGIAPSRAAAHDAIRHAARALGLT